jgi:hypothetical protein
MAPITALMNVLAGYRSPSKKHQQLRLQLHQQYFRWYQSSCSSINTRPNMKMNSLDAFIDLLELIRTNQSLPAIQPHLPVEVISEIILQGHLPPDRLRGKRLNGQLDMDIGTQPIIKMREFIKMFNYQLI